MDITPLIDEGSQIIQRYGDGNFVVSEQSFSEPLLITPTKTYRWESATSSAISTAMLTPHLEILTSHEIILLGTGGTHQPLPQECISFCLTHGLSIEAMNTGAACRTYNVLLAEGRSVAALLML